MKCGLTVWNMGLTVWNQLSSLEVNFHCCRQQVSDLSSTRRRPSEASITPRRT